MAKVIKTFKEIISEGIRPGDIWIGKYFILSNVDDGIYIEHEEGSFDCEGILMYPSDEFELQPKQYYIEYAMSELLTGKEIESVVTGRKYKLECKGSDYFSDGTKIVIFSLDELRGKWYIND